MGSATMLLLLCATVGLASASLTNLPRGGEASKDTRLSGNCPDKWVDASFVDMGCLYFNTTAGMTWDNANSMCQMDANSTLLEITLEMQMSFIRMQLAVIEDHEDAHFFWWTAATDVGINGQWIWIVSLTAVEDWMWHPGQPNSHAEYNCMHLYYTVNYLGENTPCDQPFYPICQLK